MMLATMIFMTEIKGYKKWTSFGIIYGSNAITIYVLASLLSYFFYEMPLGQSSLNQYWLTAASGAGLDPKMASMMYALSYVLLLFIPAYLLYKRRIFIRL
jgi:predicted acyltransferase